MDKDLAKFDFEKLAQTRSYLQDIARVIGKVQQTYERPDKHDWHRGLGVTKAGLVSKALSGTRIKITLDLQKGEVQAGNRMWKLGEIHASDLLDQMGDWLVEQGISEKPAQPDYESGSVVYDRHISRAIGHSLAWAAELFEAFKQTISSGKTSPVLLYPHHFDLSLVWFPFGDAAQMGFGFSFGDQFIAGPYFYTTAWPQPDGFGKIALDKPAYWFSKGFHGAILRYRDLLEQSDPAQTVMKYCSNLLEHGSPLLKPTV